MNTTQIPKIIATEFPVSASSRDIPPNSYPYPDGSTSAATSRTALIACPELYLTWLDSLGKRMHWLEEILPTLGIDAQYIIGRAEEALEGRREQYDFATSRAVARLNILLELTAPYVKVGGAVLAMKGAAAEEELKEAKGAIKKLGLQLEGVHTFPLDGTAHNVIVLRKISSTPSQYPRRYSKIKQSPL